MDSFNLWKYQNVIGKLLIIASILILGAISAIFVILNSGKIIAGVSIDGIGIGGLDRLQAEKLLGERFNLAADKKVVLTYEKRRINLVLDSVGIAVDLQETINQAYKVGRNGNVWEQLKTRLEFKRTGTSLQPVFKINQPILDSFYHLLEAGIAQEPVRPLISVDRHGQVQHRPGRKGLSIDTERLTNLLKTAAYRRDLVKIEIPVKTIEPPFTDNDIKKWQLDQILGTYTTKFDATQSDRTQNLILASSAIDNVLVYPGQNFSFNTWVGPRVTEAGFREAPVVFMGKLIPGIGGGVCQVSTTLYNAALLANLTIVERLNHSLPSTYVPLAHDATVVYGGIDLIFTNINPTPVLITANVSGPYLTISILGRKLEWETVTLEKNILETIPFKTREVPDQTVLRGKRNKISPGRKGYKVELWRKVLMKDGSLKKELMNTSIYPPQPEEYKVGIKVE